MKDAAGEASQAIACPNSSTDPMRRKGMSDATLAASSSTVLLLLAAWLVNSCSTRSVQVKVGLMELTRILVEELRAAGSSVMAFAAGPGLVRTEMTELQVETEAGRKWIPSTRESFETGKLREPGEIAEVSAELVERARPEWSGRTISPDTDLDDW